jgi:hypothetical protein
VDSTKYGLVKRAKDVDMREPQKSPDQEGRGKSSHQNAAKLANIQKGRHPLNYIRMNT